MRNIIIMSVMTTLLLTSCTPIPEKRVEDYGDVISEQHLDEPMAASLEVDDRSTTTKYLNAILDIDDLASANNYLGENIGENPEENDEMVMLVVDYLLDRSYYFDQDMEAGILTVEMINEGLKNNGFQFFYEADGHFRVNYSYFNQFSESLTDVMNDELALVVKVDEVYYQNETLTIVNIVDLLDEIIGVMKDDHRFKPELFASKLDIYEMLMYKEDKYSFYDGDGYLREADFQLFEEFVDNIKRPEEARVLKKFLEGLIDE